MHEFEVLSIFAVVSAVYFSVFLVVEKFFLIPPERDAS